MQRVKVLFVVSVPVLCAPEELRQWVEFQLGFRAAIPGNNPLANYGLVVSDPYTQLDITPIDGEQLRLFRK